MIMLADKSQNEKQFDRMLTDGLRRCEKTVSADFADRVLSSVQLRAQQKLLAKVILQERLALAGCIVASIGTIAVIVFLQQITETLSGLTARLSSSIGQAIISGQFEWQPTMILTIAAVVAACGIFELFSAEN
jgi:hypothetical protein